VVLAALSSAVLMALVVTSPSWTRQQAIEYTQALADRSGFAARVALAVSGATRDASDVWLQGWSNTPETSRASVGIGYSRANLELQNLRDAGTYDDRIAQLAQAYGLDSNGSKDLDYDHVASRILGRLGGRSSSAPVASLSLL
jgi:hypothetical protein